MRDSGFTNMGLRNAQCVCVGVPLGVSLGCVFYSTRFISCSRSSLVSALSKIGYHFFLVFSIFCRRGDIFFPWSQLDSVGTAGTVVRW